MHETSSNQPQTFPTPKSPPSTYQGINNKCPEPIPIPEKPMLPSLLPVRIVTRQPDGQYTIVLMYPGPTREQFLERFLACYGKSRTEKSLLPPIIDLFLMRRRIVTDVVVSVVPSNPVLVISFESSKVHRPLTSAINNPSLVQNRLDFVQTDLSPYFMSSTPLPADFAKPLTYPALMLDRTLCVKRKVIWSVMALAIAFITGVLGGGCATKQRCDFDLALNVGGDVISVLAMVQVLLLHGTS